MKKRILYLILAIVSFAVCVMIVAFFSQCRFIRGFIGDVIIIFQMYFLIKVFIDVKPLKLALFTLISAFTVEILQYFRIISVLGLEHNKIARVVIGSVFDPLDLLAYFTGAVLVYAIDNGFLNKQLRTNKLNSVP